MRKELTEEEYKTLHFNNGRKTHDMMYFTVNGKQLQKAVSKTPSDRRWVLNWRAEARRQIKEARQ